MSRESRQDSLPYDRVQVEHVPSVLDEGIPVLADDLVIVPLGVQVEREVLLAAPVELGGIASDLEGGGEKVALDSFDARSGDGVLLARFPDVADDLLLEGSELGPCLIDVYLARRMLPWFRL